jgi:membrane protease YdiL (CAAX protease family)
MFRALRPYFITLSCIWIGLIVAANIYAHKSPQYSHWIMAGVLPAFLFESAFFLAVGFKATRKLFSRISPPIMQSLLLWVSSFIPYLLISLTAHTFDGHSFLVICGISALVSFWWVVSPRRLVLDIAFLCVAAAVIVVRLFSWLYISPMPHFDVNVLGHLMWIRITFLAFLVQRGFKVAGVGFWPHAREWREGVLQFSIALLPLSLIAVGLHVVKFAPQHLDAPLWIGLALGYFAGTFVVVAFSEDIFRSIITELFLQRQKPVAFAVIASALILGATHLGYRGFPNWSFALVGAIGHLFYTIAYVRARSVRASMVAHALTVVAWRMFFRA